MDTHFRAKLLITYGTHVLTFSLRNFDPMFAVMLLAGELDEQYARILQPQGDTTILSLPDGTWKYTLEPPEEDAWQQPDFDDQTWPSLIEKLIITRSKIYGGDIDYWTKGLIGQGARGLGIDTNATPVPQRRTLPGIYLRKVFTLAKNTHQG